MHVCIDGVAFENGHQRGVQRYVRGVVDHLPRDFRVDVLLGRNPRAALPERARAVALTPSLLRTVPRSLRAKLAMGPRRRHEGAADIFHSSYYTLPVTDTPSVVTVYDMIVERYTDYFHNRWADQECERKQRAIEGAGALIAISHATATELCTIYPSVRDRVAPIQLGIDHIAAAPEPSARTQDKAYALFVGDRGAYKNFRCVLEAAAGRSWPKGLELMLVGEAPRANELTWASRIDSICFAGRVSDERLRELYAGARATIVPSLAEGFGLPVLEAQRSGCPVVCSDIPVFREIAGDAAVFFDPTKPDQLGEALAHACEPAESLRLSAGGLANAAGYTWARCAEQTVEVYRRVAQRS
jgi:glycosyltransferase involved in cell wall biosynthesis